MDQLGKDYMPTYMRSGNSKMQGCVEPGDTLIPSFRRHRQIGSELEASLH